MHCRKDMLWESFIWVERFELIPLGNEEFGLVSKRSLFYITVCVRAGGIGLLESREVRVS